jgi:hypothetical protein
MVAVEAASAEDASLEGKSVTVRDRNGRILLQGRLHQGRLARLCDDLAGVDLGAWTLVVDDGHDAMG